MQTMHHVWGDNPTNQGGYWTIHTWTTPDYALPDAQHLLTPRARESEGSDISLVTQSIAQLDFKCLEIGKSLQKILGGHVSSRHSAHRRPLRLGHGLRRSGARCTHIARQKSSFATGVQ